MLLTVLSATTYEISLYSAMEKGSKSFQVDQQTLHEVQIVTFTFKGLDANVRTDS